MIPNKPLDAINSELPILPTSKSKVGAVRDWKAGSETFILVMPGLPIRVLEETNDTLERVKLNKFLKQVFRPARYDKRPSLSQKRKTNIS